MDKLAQSEVAGGHVRSRRAYISMVTNDSYFSGVVALQKSILRAKCEFPLYIMVGPHVSEAIRLRIGTICAGTISVPEIMRRSKSSIDATGPWDQSEYTKLNLW